MYLPFFINLNGSLQTCVHSPLLPLLPPFIKLNRQQPEYELHRAPCIKTSFSISILMFSISFNDISLSSTTLVTPSDFNNLIPSLLWLWHCVEAWTSISRNIFLTNDIIPISCIIKASTPIWYRYFIYSKKSFISLL